jgi:hypothetical protein
LRDFLRVRFLEACKFLALASFGGAPYGIDETGVVKCVFKAGCAVGARMQIADKMSVDLSDVDRRTHEPTGDCGLLGCREWEVRPHLEISSLKTIGMTTGQAEPPL